MRRRKWSMPLALTVVLLAAGHTRAGARDWRQRLVQPSPQFSQMPFWFWNDRLSDEEIKRQMADFREHGVFGFVIHPRMGLPKDMPYMGEQWLHFIQTAVEEAARTNMRVCLYDEAMYPSGSAHGEVVKSNPAFAAKGLAMAVRDVVGPARIEKPAGEGDRIATVVGKHTGVKDALDPDSLKLIDPQTREIDVPAGDWRVMTFTCVPSEGRIRGVFEGEEANEPSAPKAADLLNPEAMKAFLRLAYEPYYETLKVHFGRCVIGMFTDEPSMLGRGPRPGLKPWTQGFAESFQAKRGYSLLPLLPGLFCDIGPKTNSIRRDFELALEHRLEEAYYLPLSRWCEEHGIALTGHPAGATEIQPLRNFQMPGQDIVWRGVAPEGNKALEGPNSAIAKCSSSVARHDERRRNLNEVFGAFGWQLTMEEMKWLSDWLMVRGVNLLSPHAFYYSIRDYRVQERPPDLGPHNAWWPHYRVFADYTARICGLLTDSRQVCNVAILGSNHELAWRAAKFLQQNQVDFNYLEDWRLVERAQFDRGRVVVGPMAYSVIIVDQDEPPSGAISAKLKAFESAGGKVRYCTGEPSPALLEGLVRDTQVEPAAPDLRYAHVIKNGVDFYFLVNEGENPIDTRITVRRTGPAEWFDAWEGQFHPADVVAVNEATMTVSLVLGRRESIVLCVDGASNTQAVSKGSGGINSPARRIQVTGPWRVLDASGKQVLERLGDWLEDPATSAYTGTLRYETAFEISTSSESAYSIDLGQVGDFATLSVNGHELPVRFWAPYRWDVTDLIHSGRNELAVSVTNSLVNKYDAKIIRASGLIGPVELISIPQERRVGTSLPAASDRSAPPHRIRVSAIQMLPATGDPKANIERADRLVRQAVKEYEAQVLVLPECTLTGYTNPSDGKMTLAQTRELAETVPGRSVQHFADLARELGVYIVWGLHERRGDRYFNSAVLLSPEGTIDGTYSKVHINKYEGEMGWTHGEGFHVWPCRLGDTSFNVGIMICYDREVPEAARCLAVLEADLILVPQATGCTAMFPIHRDQLRVRAYENEVYLAMANWGGPKFRGHSMIISPGGDVLKLGLLDEEILTAELDLDELRRIHLNGIYGRHHRQPGAYRPLMFGSEPAQGR